ncbi:MAG: UDP-N-acetylglucosamine 2-epimerase (non-hydrolyzing) [Patiriisocius sp.]|jgi:UDP-N-acetylglucosamine 2-epimerase (non-hydrolysing)
MACSIVAKKMGMKVAHVEGGLRSFDLSMPEEINRMVTDSISDYFFTTSEVANVNLKNIGIKEKQIFFVGNTMIDSLLSNIHRLKKPTCFDKFNLKTGNYIVTTLHRPGNVDQELKFKARLDSIVIASNGIPIIFPVHPRTQNQLASLGIEANNLHFVEPLSYLEFNYLVKKAMAVITDSGGVTEETTVMGIPCLTLRDNTERPETVELGTNCLVGTSPSKLSIALNDIIQGNWKKGEIPEKWDGKTSKRIIEKIIQFESPNHLKAIL